MEKTLQGVLQQVESNIKNGISEFEISGSVAKFENQTRPL